MMPSTPIQKQILGKRTTSTNRRVRRDEEKPDGNEDSSSSEQEPPKQCRRKTKHSDVDPEVTHGKVLVSTMIWNKVLSKQSAFEDRQGSLVTSLPGRFDPCKNSSYNEELCDFISYLDDYAKNSQTAIETNKVIKDMRLNIGLSNMKVIGKTQGFKITLVGTDNFYGGEEIKMEVFTGKPRDLATFFSDAQTRNGELLTYKFQYFNLFVAILKQQQQ